ncbi:MEGF10 [Symbiodinium sp. CCMP2592]|nr:MEGF10 [Symbiodinium sp. CCMP2592]
MRDPFLSIADARFPSLHSKSTARGTCLGCWTYLGDTQDSTFEEALRGLTPSQRAFFENTIKKAHVLHIMGIKEQRRSVGWKWVECICVALTPICISTLDSFGKHFQEPIKLIAILFSLFSTLCRLSPQGRGEALLYYSGLLRKVCWSYWSVSGEFEDYRGRDDSDFEDSKGDAQKFWQEFSKNKRESKKKPRQSQAQQRQTHAGTEDRANEEGEDRANEEGEDLASSVLQTPFVECLPNYLTETEKMRAALFEKFVEEVVQCTEEGEDELQRSYGSPGSAPRVIRSKDGDDDDKQDIRRRNKRKSEDNHGKSDEHHKDKELRKLQEELAAAKKLLSSSTPGGEE